MTDVLMVHGRSQHDKDAASLKYEWVAALRQGLLASALDFPVLDDAIRFPYYGDTLRDLVKKRQVIADVVVRGPVSDTEEADFLQAVLIETVGVLGVTSEQIDAERVDGNDFSGIRRDADSRSWVGAALRAIDLHVPGASSASIAAVARDVYLYLRNVGIRDRIETGVRGAMRPGVPTVVVAHSLGSVVAYNLLRRDGEKEGWTVPLFVTVGSPLGVSAIRKALRPNGRPSCVAHWFNARDFRDVVALHPLDVARFPADPPIEDKSDVKNGTRNHHGIVGYLSDSEVARRIRLAI